MVKRISAFQSDGSCALRTETYGHEGVDTASLSRRLLPVVHEGQGSADQLQVGAYTPGGMVLGGRSFGRPREGMMLPGPEKRCRLASVMGQRSASEEHPLSQRRQRLDCITEIIQGGAWLGLADDWRRTEVVFEVSSYSTILT